MVVTLRNRNLSSISHVTCVFFGGKREKTKGMKRPADRAGNRPKRGRSAWGSDKDEGNEKMATTAKHGEGARGMNAHVQH